MHQENPNTDILTTVTNYIEHEYAVPNQTIYEINQPSDRMYLILHGEVGVFSRLDVESMTLNQISIHEKVKERFKKVTNKFQQYSISKLQALIPMKNNLILKQTLSEGKSFGTMALINQKSREFTIRALTICHFVILRRSYYLQIMQMNQEKKTMQELGFFAKLPIFENWGIQQIKNIYVNCKELTYRMNNMVYQQEQSIEGVYCVRSGTFDIQSEERRQQKTHRDQLQSEQLNETIKIQIKRLATVTENTILSLEEWDSQLHQFSCKCSSSQGSVVMIPIDLFIQRIFNHQTSKLYINDYVKFTQKFLNDRVRHVLDQLQIFNHHKNVNYDAEYNRKSVSSMKYKLNQSQFELTMVAQQRTERNSKHQAQPIWQRPKDLSQYARHLKNQQQSQFMLAQINQMLKQPDMPEYDIAKKRVLSLKKLRNLSSHQELDRSITKRLSQRSQSQYSKLQLK